MATAWLTLLHAPLLLEGADDTLLQTLARQLGPAEQTRLPGFVRQRRWRQFILGRLLLRVGVARAACCPVPRIDVVERIGAGPRIVLPPALGKTIQASLSHAGDWIACASATGFALGVDIETSRPARDLATLAQSAMSPGEQRWLLAQREHDPAFYQLWCGKESLYKYRNNAGLPAPPGLPELLCDDVDAAPGAAGATLTALHDRDAGLHLALCCPREADLNVEKILLEQIQKRFTWSNK